MTGKKVTLFQYIRKIINNVNNYRPDSLLPICSKIFEKLVSDGIFEFIIKNNLLKSTKSGFKPNDSYVNQIVSITDSIFNPFDANPSSSWCLLRLIKGIWQSLAWMNSGICGALRDLAPFVQFKKRGKHPQRSVNFSKFAGFNLQLY